MKQNKIKGFIILLITSIVWGFAFVAQDIAAKHIQPFTVNALRCIIGALVLLPVIIFSSIKNKRPIFEKDKRKRNDLIAASILCGVFLCIGVNLQQFGISMYPIDAATSGRSGFITALYVVFVPITGVFLKKKLGLNSLISVLLATIGMYLLCLSNGLKHVYLGDLVVLGSAFGFTLQILCIDRFSHLVDGIKLSALQFFVCGVLSTILMFIFETPTIENIKESLLPILYLGIVSSGIGYTLQIVGQQYSQRPTLDSIIMSLESVFAVIGGALILHEHLLTNEIIGCVVMFIAIIFAQLPTSIFKIDRESKETE